MAKTPTIPDDGSAAAVMPPEAAVAEIPTPHAESSASMPSAVPAVLSVADSKPSAGAVMQTALPGREVTLAQARGMKKH
jgi:hypothetical protein